MAFTRKHYEAIAKIIGTYKGHRAVGQSHNLTAELIALFKQDNPRFNADRFREAVDTAQGDAMDDFYEQHSNAR